MVEGNFVETLFLNVTNIVLEYTWLLIVLFLMGKMGITASFAIVYVHTAEMLPTVS